MSRPLAGTARSEGHAAQLLSQLHTLQEKVRLRAGLPAGDRPGFFDQNDVELGEEWREELRDALNENPIMVCLYSPGYFRSEYCGREWAFFHKRRQLAAADQGARLPPVIKPVIWIELKEGCPRGSEDRSICWVIHTRSTTSWACTRCSSRRGNTRASTRTSCGVSPTRSSTTGPSSPLPGLAPPPALMDITPAFGLRGPDPPPGVDGEAGPNYVKFVFVAAKPGEIATVRKATDAYLKVGGRDWKPFLPARARPIRAIAQWVASGEDLSLYSEELPFTRDLGNEVRQAEDLRNVVVVFVDPWTAGLDSYRATLQAFDRQNYINGSIVLPRNDQDPETKGNLAVLDQNVESAFFFHRNLGPLFFREPVRSEDELTTALRDILVRIRAEIINKAEVTRKVPAGREKPSVTGPES